jgi:hypothetical protein
VGFIDVLVNTMGAYIRGITVCVCLVSGVQGGSSGGYGGDHHITQDLEDAMVGVCLSAGLILISLSFLCGD